MTRGPVSVSSADYAIQVSPFNILETLDDRTVITPRPKIIGDIYILARCVFGRPHAEAVRFAEAISRKPHPSLLADVGAQEGGFNPRAPITYGGCRGAFQVSPKDWGAVPGDIEGQVDQASMVLELALKEQKGTTMGLRRYNGDPDSPATEPYPAAVRKWTVLLVKH
jgi:hypothetical protein